MKTLSWWMIIAILVTAALAGGLFFGLAGDWLGLSPGVKTGGVGVCGGVAAAVLITRRRASISKQQNG